MKELIVISGKGGTGKTSILASFAALAENRAVLADCDVDAADLHLVLEPRVLRRENFIGGNKAKIKPGHCTACGKCEELCRFDAIYYDGPGNGRVGKTFRIDDLACEGCGVCAHYCAEDAIEFAPAVTGQWFVSETRFGPMVHAKMGIGAENSGKLVTLIRQTAKDMAVERRLDLILCDGSPGIGCPVIASLTAASLALVVVEPTASGLHDFRRVAELLSRLGVPGLMMVNKADLNDEVAQCLETEARQLDISPVGRVPYDPAVTHAQIARKTVIETSDGPAAKTICEIWNEVEERLQISIPSGSSGLVQLTHP
jgi:MinD superfamily P-loop ATPase